MIEIANLFKIEKDIEEKSTSEKVEIRQKQAKLVLEDFLNL